MGLWVWRFVLELRRSEKSLAVLPKSLRWEAWQCWYLTKVEQSCFCSSSVASENWNLILSGICWVSWENGKIERGRLIIWEGFELFTWLLVLRREEQRTRGLGSERSG